ncbi:MAG: Gfo/Idh/MocA family protein, partial [Promethearchaeota archaeon]
MTRNNKESLSQPQKSTGDFVTNENKKRIRLGIVGCGMISNNLMLARHFDKIKEIEFVAALDVNADKARKFAKKNGIKESYTCIDDMLDAGGLDAVYLAVPHHLHLPLFKRVVKAGLHVFCEKPIALNVKEGLEMVSLAEKHGIKFGINYLYRYDKGIHRMVKTIHAGNLGKPFYSIALIPWLRKEDNYFSKSPWHKKWETSGGGTLITHASHSIDIMAWALGKPAIISGEHDTFRYREIGLEVEDVAAGLIKFK